MVATKAALSIRVDALTDSNDKSDGAAASIGLENRTKLESCLRALEHQSELGITNNFSQNGNKKQARFSMSGETKTYNTKADAVDFVSTQRDDPLQAAVQAVLDVKEEKKRAKEERRAKKKAEKNKQEEEVEENEDEMEIDGEKEPKESKKEKKRKRRESDIPPAEDEEATKVGFLSSSSTCPTDRSIRRQRKNERQEKRPRRPRRLRRLRKLLHRVTHRKRRRKSRTRATYTLLIITLHHPYISRFAVV